MKVRMGHNAGKLLLHMATWIVFGGLAVVAQTSTLPAKDKTTPAFDVVSIKPDNGSSQYHAFHPTPAGYVASNTPLDRVIRQSYLGILVTPDERLKGAPSWVLNAPYDITAKADEATIQAMHSMTMAQQLTLEAPMLRAMLEDRFKLVAHTQPVEVQGYTLVVGKHGIKMKETPPGEPLPENGMSFGDGSWKVVTRRGADGKPSGSAYYQITMAELASGFAQGATPVVDQTGLTARYDFELPLMDAVSPDGAAGPAPPPQLDIAHRFDWAAIGLEMKPVKASLLTVVIDHIEKPTPN